jgi:hypothetical protein
MRSRAAGLAVLSFALVAVGCRRSPFATSGDAGVDAPVGTPSVGDAARETIELTPDAPGDAAPNNSPAADGAPSSDAASDDGAAHDATTADTPINDDAPVADVAAETARSDGSTDTATGDGPAGDAPIDVAADASTTDGGDARPEDQPCGPLAFNCAPFACDVALGICKTHCTTNADCVSGKLCNAVGLCGFREDTICTSNAECASGFCAQGVCCDTACTGPCMSCAWPGANGTCTAVPRGVLDPSGICGTAGTCNGRGGCVPTTCVADSDCGELYWCTNGHCVACNATCVSSADCVPGAVCNMRNFCTGCYPADAGALP